MELLENKTKLINNKINAIKTLRSFCFETWGYNCGLLEAKTAVESVMERQEVAVSVELITKAVNELPWDNPVRLELEEFLGKEKSPF